jgi:surface carbohydrate biosynthesis protein (TIGR04326 family)
VQGLRRRLTPADVIVAAPGYLQHCPGITARKIWYFGDDYRESVQVAAASKSLGADFVAAGDALNAVAGRTGPDIIELDAVLFSGKQQIAWLASDLAERNPYASPFCRDLCRTIALIDACREGGAHLVLVDNAGFGRALVQACRDNGIAARWAGKQITRESFLGAFRAHSGFLRRWRRERRAAAQHRADESALRAADIILVSWAEGKRDDAANAPDRFLGTLLQWLREKGLRVGCLFNSTHWLNSAEAMAAFAACRVPPGSGALTTRFFGLADLLRAYRDLLALPAAVAFRYSISGLDLTRIVRLALRREFASSRLVSAALYARLAAALKRAGMKPRVIFYPFENQPWEKAMLAGFRRDLPQATLIGIQHASIAERYFSGHPSRRQWSDGTAPNLLVTMGEEFHDRLAAKGAPRQRLAVGGALRYGAMLQDARRELSGKKTPEKLIVAACSMEIRDSFELAHKAALATAGIEGARLIINFHPLTEIAFRDSIRERLGSVADCSNVEFVAGGVQELLEKADLLLYNSSSVALDATAAGVPVIYVGSDVDFDLDNLAGADIPRVRSAASLREEITELLRDPVRCRKINEVARAYLAYCMSVPNPEFWLELARGHDTDRSAYGAADSFA